MLSMKEYIDAHGPPEKMITDETVFQHFLNQNLFHESEGIYSKDDLEEKHLKVLESYKREKIAKYYDNWSALFEQFLQYKRPFLVNGVHVQNLSYEDLYVQPCFISSGRQYFVIQTGELASDLHLLRSVIPFR